MIGNRIDDGPDASAAPCAISTRSEKVVLRIAMSVGVVKLNDASLTLLRPALSCSSKLRKSVVDEASIGVEMRSHVYADAHTERQTRA